jgi:hypothetical protein
MRAFPSERDVRSMLRNRSKRGRQWHNVNYGEHTSTTRKAEKNFGHHLKLLGLSPGFGNEARAATRLRLRPVLFTV